jgi:hypothetical protein
MGDRSALQPNVQSGVARGRDITMTLNITVAARWMMTQSSDFRLTRGSHLVSNAAQKQFVLHYHDWAGVVSYTGVASAPGHDTAVWLEQVLTHALAHRSRAMVVRRLAEEGSEWLSHVPRPYRLHSFTMISYERGRPRVDVISNFERAGGEPLPEPLDHFVVSHVRPRAPRLIITGQPQVVTASQREALTSLLATSPSPDSMRHAVALVSREAAGRTAGTVGTECVVAHLLPDGSGEAQVFGNLNAEFLPVMVSNGVNVSDFTPSAMTQTEVAGPMRLVGATWNGNRDLTAMVGAFRELSKQTNDGWPPVPD